MDTDIYCSVVDGTVDAFIESILFRVVRVLGMMWKQKMAYYYFICAERKSFGLSVKRRSGGFF